MKTPRFTIASSRGMNTTSGWMLYNRPDGQDGCIVCHYPTKETVCVPTTAERSGN